MKPLLFLTALSLPFSVIAQGPNTNPPAQTAQNKNINYYQLINNEDNNVQTNIVTQQANPSAPRQQGVSLGSLFGSNDQNDAPCTDCDKVKQALNTSRASSGGSQQKHSLGIKKWSKTFSGKMNMKMKKTFSRRHKVRTNYAICFNWH